ncbi:hypothetical protein ALC60_01265 [Trachymyrmex zeteki]|uniref:Uncharacterized protein n=1 Tax=Mycetomoellerius zeteki TaxID=64791 RepID=A0A151XGS2_9HYME|nr:hypothetical protein ALC60_01265 [Trachymyrmex zeteki]
MAGGRGETERAQVREKPWPARRGASDQPSTSQSSVLRRASEIAAVRSLGVVTRARATATTRRRRPTVCRSPAWTVNTRDTRTRRESRLLPLANYTSKESTWRWGCSQRTRF